MNKYTEQEKFWTSDFGDDYRKRNNYGPDELDNHYLNTWGVTRSDMNISFISGFEEKRVLEVGCNVGNQLQLLEKQGFKNLHGIEINEHTAELAKTNCPNAQILQGSAFELPFDDGYFDLVFTSGVLIHISPDSIEKVLKEIYRTTNEYIWGFEYYAEGMEEINYRGHSNKLWKNNYSKLFLELFPDLELTKENLFPYKQNNNTDTMYLLRKV